METGNAYFESAKPLFEHPVARRRPLTLPSPIKFRYIALAEQVCEHCSNQKVEVFEPAPADWWKGGLLSSSIDDIADELKSPRKDESFLHALKYELFPEKFDIVGEERGHESDTR